MDSAKNHEIAALVARVLNLPEGSVAPDASSSSVSGWDSLAQLQICLAVEERFHVSLSMEQIARATSVDELAALLP